jgi:putative methyltransferase (TIGR04325 family)
MTIILVSSFAATVAADSDRDPCAVDRSNPMSPLPKSKASGARMFRELIADLTPPILFRLLQRLHRRNRYDAKQAPQAMFQGHYPSLESVPCGTGRYNDDELAALSAKPHLEGLQNAGIPKERIHRTGRHLLLPLAISQFVEGPITVLDVGGGGCLGLTEILDHVPNLNLTTFRYINVDTSAMCRFMREPVETILKSKFGTSSFVTMTDEIPNSLDAPLIINAASSLEYVSDYRALLLRLGRLAPEVLILSFTPMSDRPTYACQQRLQNHLLACRVFNRTELISDMEHLGFRIGFTVDHALPPLTFKDTPGPFSLVSIMFRSPLRS